MWSVAALAVSLTLAIAQPPPQPSQSSTSSALPSPLAAATTTSNTSSTKNSTLFFTADAEDFFDAFDFEVDPLAKKHLGESSNQTKVNEAEEEEQEKQLPLTKDSLTPLNDSTGEEERDEGAYLSQASPTDKQGLQKEEKEEELLTGAAVNDSREDIWDFSEEGEEPSAVQLNDDYDDIAHKNVSLSNLKQGDAEEKLEEDGLIESVANETHEIVDELSSREENLNSSSKLTNEKVNIKNETLKIDEEIDFKNENRQDDRNIPNTFGFDIIVDDAEEKEKDGEAEEAEEEVAVEDVVVEEEVKEGILELAPGSHGHSTNSPGVNATESFDNLEEQEKEEEEALVVVVEVEEKEKDENAQDPFEGQLQEPIQEKSTEKEHQEEPVEDQSQDGVAADQPLPLLLPVFDPRQAAALRGKTPDEGVILVTAPLQENMEEAEKKDNVEDQAEFRFVFPGVVAPTATSDSPQNVSEELILDEKVLVDVGGMPKVCKQQIQQVRFNIFFVIKAIRIEKYKTFVFS
jgi:hypothetical protein